MPEFSPVFVQKIFCFVQIPESFVQKHKTAAGKNKENTKENFSETPRNSTVRNRKMMKFYAKKGKKSPPLPRTITKSEQKSKNKHTSPRP